MSEHQTWVGAIATLVVIVGFGLAFGVLGLSAGLGVTIAWYFFPVPYTFALGHIALVALTPENALPGRLVPVEIGFAGLLLSEVPTVDEPLRFVIAVVLTALALGIAAWVGLRWGNAVWIAAISLAAIATVLAYGLHRYELVRLDLIEADQT